MADPKEVRSLDIVGAIRLALVGASDDRAAVRVIEKLCEYAPPTPAAATGPVELLLDACRDTGGRFAVAAAGVSGDTAEEVAA